MASKENVLVVDGITKIFGKANSPQAVVALDNLSLTIQEGANSILGPNGAGKSTLIKVLLGYLKPDKGSAQLLGYDIEKEGKKIRQRVGYMPESYTLIPGVNAVKQVSMLGRIAGLPTAEAMQRAHETLQYVGLDEARYRKVNEFSTGMLQRLKLAQALVNDPELLILDEPTNGLDPKGRVDMISLIREITYDNGVDIIVSSHLLPDIEATCEYTAILNKGALITQGKIDELKYQETKDRPVQTMTVRIKGSLNDFLIALRNDGFTFKVIDKIIHIPFTNEEFPKKLLKLAQATNVQIRMMIPQQVILEDVFVHKIEDNDLIPEEMFSTEIEGEDEI